MNIFTLFSETQQKILKGIETFQDDMMKVCQANYHLLKYIEITTELSNRYTGRMNEKS